jgi:hypothetical protein
LLLLSLETSPTTVSEKVPPQAIAGIDGNHGDKDGDEELDEVAIDVGGKSDCVGGNTEGGNVVCEGGRNGTGCCCIGAIWAYATDIFITINKQIKIIENNDSITFLPIVDISNIPI